MFSNTPLLNPVHRPPPAPLDPITKTIVKLQPAHSLRHAHVLRLYDILLHLVSLPPCYSNSVQSLRAWRALTKCSEFELAASFHLGAKVIERSRAEQDDEDDDEDDEEERNWRQGKRAEWLKWNQEGKVDKVDKLNEYVLSLAAAGRARHGLDELESFLPAHPYHDSISLNTLAGLLALLLAQPTSSRGKSSSSSSSSSDSDTSSSSTKPAPSKPKAVETTTEESGTEPDFTQLLRDLSIYSTKLLSQAREHFRRASRLEQKSPELSTGEATRWLAILDSASSARNTNNKRSRSPSFSPSASP